MDEQENKKSAWSVLGKGALNVLKETALEKANEKIDETKRDLYAAGDDLLDRLILQLKFIGFLIVAGVLMIVGATLGVSEKFQIPYWVVALAAGAAVWVVGLIWKSKNISARKTDQTTES